jgi:hypothetical protein
MKYVRVLVESGKRIRLNKVNPDDKVIGIMLSSGHIVSLNLVSPDSKIFSSDFRGIKGIEDLKKAEKDFGGKENTSKLPLLLELKESEYIPALGELKKAVKELWKIRYVREILHLDSIPQYCWFLSSTVRNNETMWIVGSDGYTYWYSWYYYYRYCDYVLAFLRRVTELNERNGI